MIMLILQCFASLFLLTSLTAEEGCRVDQLKGCNYQHKKHSSIVQRIFVICIVMCHELVFLNQVIFFLLLCRSYISCHLWSLLSWLNIYYLFSSMQPLSELSKKVNKLVFIFITFTKRLLNIFSLLPFLIHVLQFSISVRSFYYNSLNVFLVTRSLQNSRTAQVMTTKF